MVNKEEFPALLNAGIHAVTLDELHIQCVASFPESENRHELFDGLQRFIDDFHHFGISGTLWIDGSFVTQKQNPGDIDIVLLLNHVELNALSPEQQQSLLILFDNTTAKERYGLDLYPIDADHSLWPAYWRGLFGFFRDGQTAKGIAEVTL